MCVVDMRFNPITPELFRLRMLRLRFPGGGGGSSEVKFEFGGGVL